MDQVQSMRVFVRVAQQSSFAAAARDLRISTASVSKCITALESRIGARLLDRTTRHVSLTEAGRVYLERCLECLQVLEDADASVGHLNDEPRGRLTATAPADLGMTLVPVIAELLHAYPDLSIDLRLSNRVVDLVDEGVDVSVRVSTGLDDRNYVARQLACTHLAVVAAPDYLRRHGRPRKPEDLTSHRSLVFTEPTAREELVFARGRRVVRVKLDVAMWANSGAELIATARHGAGLALTPSFLAASELASGALEPVLLDWSLPVARLFAVYPHRRFVAPKVRVFVDALRHHLGDSTGDRWWPERLTLPGAANRTRRQQARRGAT